MEPGQGAVVAQRLDAQMQARRARAEAAIAVWQAAARAAQRRAVDHRGNGDVAGAARTQARDRDRAAGKLRALARALSRSASSLGGCASALICWLCMRNGVAVSPMSRRRSG